MMLLLKSVAKSLGQTSPPPPPPAATPVLLATPTHTPEPVPAPTPEYVAPPAALAPQQQSGSATYYYREFDLNSAFFSFVHATMDPDPDSCFF
jgi:hypothetical protein